MVEMLDFLKRLFGIGSDGRRKPRMRYAPQIASANAVARYRVRGRAAVLLGNIVSSSTIQYLYILVVYERDGDPCLFVASEVNSERETFGGGSHFLGVFPGNGHLNLGDSDEWADRNRFVERALEIAEERLTGKSK